MARLNRANKSVFENILRLIQEAKNRAFSAVNAELVLLYFNVGKISADQIEDLAKRRGQSIEEVRRQLSSLVD